MQRVLQFGRVDMHMYNLDIVCELKIIYIKHIREIMYAREVA